MKHGMTIMRTLLCVVGVGVFSEPFSEPGGDAGIAKPEPLFVFKTSKPMLQAVEDLKAAIINNNYVFIRQQTIDSRLVDDAGENDRVILVYFCNFNMLSRALKTDTRAGVFLPCRITLIQMQGYVELVAVNPKLVSKYLEDESLNDICDQLTKDYGEILENAVL